MQEILNFQYFVIAVRYNMHLNVRFMMVRSDTDSHAVIMYGVLTI